MSQIPRAQFAQKKRQITPVATVQLLDIEAKTKKSSYTNGSSNGNGHKNAFDNDVMIISDDDFPLVGHEEIVGDQAAPEEVSPKKKPRSRRSKDSTESKDSDAKSVKASSQEEQSKADSNQSSKDIKILKLSAEELLSSKQRRSNRLENASTIVNLSTVSSTDQSTKISDETLETTPTATERRVSGRRSTRPIDEIKFSYRTPNPDESLNRTTDATIGSEFNNDSLLATPGTDRKRPFNASTESIDSPKRSRLSGLFSSFSSPVAMLRNRFRAANIASTPVAGKAEVKLDDTVESLNVSSGEEMKEIDLNEKDEPAAVGENEEELKVTTTPIKKSCAIM